MTTATKPVTRRSREERVSAGERAVKYMYSRLTDDPNGLTLREVERRFGYSCEKILKLDVHDYLDEHGGDSDRGAMHSTVRAFLGSLSLPKSKRREMAELMKLCIESDDFIFDDFSEIAAALSVPRSTALHWYKHNGDASWPTPAEVTRQAAERREKRINSNTEALQPLVDAILSS